MDLLKDYDCTIQYHLGKANVVADALSRKSAGFMAHLRAKEWRLLEELRDLNVELSLNSSGVLIANMRVEPVIKKKIFDAQQTDPQILHWVEEAKKGSQSKFKVSNDGILTFRGRICVPDDPKVKNQLLEEAYRSKYTMHPGSTKMYQNLHGEYWWNNMKREIAQFVSRCLVCQQVKAEHQKPVGTLQPLPIP